MHKLILLGLLTLFTLSSAKIINAVALTVDGEAITTAEIESVQKKTGFSKQQAIDLLIQDRLQKEAMQSIKISEETIDAKIAQIANLNNLTIPKMQKILQEQGTSWSSYRESIRNTLRKERFFKEKILHTITPPSENQLQRYYETHKALFTIPASLSLVEYSSTSEKNLENFLRTGTRAGIQSRAETKQTKGMNPAMLALFLSTPNGGFTKAVNAGDRWIAYRVQEKYGQRIMPFEEAHDSVARQWSQEQQNRATKDYFSKMKTEATIRIIRK